MPTFTTMSWLNPLLFLQIGVLFGSSILLFLLLFTLRDIILRTHSFVYQAACVLLVGALPIVGFLVYLLVRPARTIREREMERMLRKLTGEESIPAPMPTPVNPEKKVLIADNPTPPPSL